jgi:uncharacterized protein (TIGR02611 family)
VKTVAIAVVGGLITLAGIAMLVLPGPGFVVVAAGLAVLATRFEWARKPLDYAKVKARQGVAEVAGSTFRTALAAAGGLAMVLVGVLRLAGVQIPLMAPVTAAFVVVSGLIVLGTVVYARRTHRAPTAG